MAPLSCDTPIVEVKQGKLKGKIEKNYKGGSYCAFYGIPFAQPPIGNLRFKGPRPPLPWNGVRDALVEGDACRSRHMISNEFVGSEDCLYVNVFTRQLPPVTKLKPVLFFIHGGAFIQGSNSIDYYAGERILTEDVVLVTTNYRTGAVGAIGFKDPELDTPGNNGLKDCVASLKWVKENIEKFGGDQSNITIFGESAGSAICHYLILSPLGEGLFNRAILQSGTATCPWAFNPKSQPEILAKLLGYTGEATDEKSIHKFLLSVPIEKIAETQELVDYSTEGYEGGILPWAPFIEVTGCPSEINALTQHPLEIIKSGKFNQVPIVFGYNSEEGLLMCGKVAPPAISNMISTTNNEDFVGGFKLKRGSPESIYLGDMIKKFYYGDKAPSRENFQPFVDYCSDLLFIVQTVVSLKLHSAVSNQPVYLYRFALDLPFCRIKEMFGVPFPGCCHAEELFYLFNSVKLPVQFDSESEKIVDSMVKIWTNFAVNGDVNLPKANSLLDYKWQPCKPNHLTYLSIDTKIETKDILPEKERIAFWDNLLKQATK